MISLSEQTNTNAHIKCSTVADTVTGNTFQWSTKTK